MENQNLPSIYPSKEEFDIIQRTIKPITLSGMLPYTLTKGASPEQVFAKVMTIALKGRELRLPVMQALNTINVIQGKPTLSAEAMLALIYRDCPDCQIDYIQFDNKGCVIEARRNSKQKPSQFSFTIEDAKNAGLYPADKSSPWSKYTGDMLKARCISKMARAMFADKLMGCSYIPDEIEPKTQAENNSLDFKESVVIVEPTNAIAVAQSDVSNSRHHAEPSTDEKAAAPQEPKQHTPRKTQKEYLEETKLSVENVAEELSNLASTKQIRYLYVVASKNGYENEYVKKYLLENYNIDSANNIQKKDFNDILEVFSEKKK